MRNKSEDFNQTTNRPGRNELDFWVKRFLIRLYLLLGWAPDY